jgi:hypothetical protein
MPRSHVVLCFASTVSACTCARQTVCAIAVLGLLCCLEHLGYLRTVQRSPLVLTLMTYSLLICCTIIVILVHAGDGSDQY